MTQLPDFSVITFVPANEWGERPRCERTDLNKFFSALINGQQLEVDVHSLEQMLCQDLNINTKELDRKLVGILTEALVYYTKIWPGWERSGEYHLGQLQSKDWYGRFRQYLIFKSNFLIKNAQRFAEEAGLPTKDQKTQTTALSSTYRGNKRFAPYTLCVGGPPSVLNSVVFMESQGHIQIKQHIEKPWESLDIKELLNWPHVSVEVKLPDISLSRTNMHIFHRNLALCTDYTVLPEINRITHITKISESSDTELKPYTYDFIAAYIKQLSTVLKKIQGLNEKRLEELGDIFSEFLADIKEVDVYDCTMCPNISVGFHIGGSKYIRNKKMVSTNVDKMQQHNTAISFYEIVLPQIEVALHTFKAVQDFADKTNVTFQSLNRIVNKLIPDPSKPDVPCHPEMSKFMFLINNTCVVYNCTLCKMNFSGPHALAGINAHFAECHKTEQSVLCYKCRKQFHIKTLVGKRWAHKCS